MPHQSPQGVGAPGTGGTTWSADRDYEEFGAFAMTRKRMLCKRCSFGCA
tara:strand:+ start:2862 stop:3008 length:147 start_codon:yes stop_codon:yes gene_type:complete